ncbi:hypothetical protein, conserved [Trypanosoma vivax Y486]|uniref:Uncharacterized protein n=1 Tax=Trypanosoma vivax (strain Y486) TaxID=1055687 RepID=F9WNU7_TRYVY|nr:hypothetical protein, conserved [Trypanosoma vivax Y486]|eukprot:CCD19218.1 hypothetical protein, conserved [Trypanosoma vivax Y486]
MEGAGVIFEASRKPAEVFVVSFAVVEGKPAGPRRRFIALPKGKNDHDDCEAEAPLQHASCYPGVVFGELAAVFDRKASFFQVSLPQGSRTSFRCRAEAGRLAELTQLQMGYKGSPQMLHTATRVLVRDHAIVSSRCAAPQSLKIHVCIDSIRICGPWRGVEKRSRIASRNARQCGTALGESNYLSKKHEFIGVHFGRETGTVCQSQKTIRKLREVPPLEGLAVAELERLTSRMVCAANVRGGALLEQCFLLKAVSRRLSKLNGCILQLNDGADLPARAISQGKRCLSSLLANKSVTPRRHRPTPAALVTDVSMCGWGALLFRDSGAV